MAVNLNHEALEYAKQLINEGRVVKDERDWSEVQPKSVQEDEYINAHGLSEYGMWFLGVERQANHESKGKYEFPFGDFENVYHSGLVAAEARAEQHGHQDIGSAARTLLNMLSDQ